MDNELISRGTIESRRVKSGQLLLLPRSARDLCAEWGVALSTAVRLYDAGLLSYDPRQDTTLDESQEAEFAFLAAILANGCDPALMTGILASLPKPYRFRHSEIYYDWQNRRWRAIPELPPPAELTRHWISSLREEGDQDTLERLRSDVDAAIRSLPPAKHWPPERLPAVVCAADWSIKSHHRRAVIAVLKDDGTYLIERVTSVPEPDTLLKTLSAMAGDHGLMLGFDFPIGLPVAYAARRDFYSWRSAMATLTPSRSPEFFQLTDTPSRTQPFYPRTPGRKGQHTISTLVQALGMKSRDELLRQCERATDDRPAASSLFFTIGPKQVGRAALHGWATMLCPNLDRLSVWPFDGLLNELLAANKPVVAEIYPSEYYPLIGVPRPGWSKKRRRDRQTCAPDIRKMLRSLTAGLSDEMAKRVDKGFDSDDEFDAMVGLIGMLSVLRGQLPPDPPRNARHIAVEGWILGHPRPRTDR